METIDPYPSVEQELTVAVKLLENLIIELEVEPKTIDGTPLSKLGKGVSHACTQTIHCVVCDKAGYIVNQRPVVAECGDCHGSGVQPQTFPCFPCQATGKFTQRRTGRVVDCRVCRGSGRYISPTLTEACHACDGNKNVPVPEQFVTDYIKCSKCKGVGETEAPFNPALGIGVLQKLRHAQMLAAKN